jgi:hypothetical protein
MSNTRKVLFAAALETAERRPTSDRLAIYEALAEFAGSDEDAAPFRQLAQSLRQADEAHGRLALKFS